MPSKVAVEMEGVQYASLTDAARALGISPQAVHQRLHPRDRNREVQQRRINQRAALARIAERYGYPSTAALLRALDQEEVIITQLERH